MSKYFVWIVFFSVSFFLQASQVQLGVDQLFSKEYAPLLKGKNIGLVTNHTAINSRIQTTSSLLKSNASTYGYTIKALFAPEHGINGNQYACEDISHSKDKEGIPIFSLHGETRRPTQKMLQGINLLIFDIQDIGSRSYTYITTLFYVMEEAAKWNIPVLILDRPNPINGLVVDGPILEKKWSSMVGYISIPYCHGMTVGELGNYFNKEYEVGCQLTVIPMKGWKREMSFQETGLKWIPTSPNIPESTTAFYYPITGILGELSLVNIGVGYSLPFKIVGAPWINGSLLATKLNEQKFPGVYFSPLCFRPFFGQYAKKDCQGVLIMVVNPRIYQPISTLYLLLGMLKTLYPNEFQKSLELDKDKLAMFNKLNGTTEVYRILKEEKFVTWKLKELHKNEKAAFLEKRKLYLFTNYE